MYNRDTLEGLVGLILQFDKIRQKYDKLNLILDLILFDTCLMVGIIATS